MKGVGSSEVAVLRGRSDLQRCSSRQEFTLEGQVLCGCKLLVMFGCSGLNAIKSIGTECFEQTKATIPSLTLVQYAEKTS
jgi:hypothetical protein